MKAFLGIDTSCYTTSLCVVDEKFQILADARKILKVPSGERGLSQANMIYQHTRNLPELFERLQPIFQQYELAGVGVTGQPRRRPESYMPAFLPGLGYARSIAAMLGIRVYIISHQENHMLAVLRAVGNIATAPFFALHVSGGTTELLHVRPDAQGLEITCIGGTSDLSAGQFIDRVGVALQLPFPAGVHVERLAAAEALPVVGAPVFCKDGYISFSGPESQVQRDIQAKKRTPSGCCSHTLATVWRGLEQLLDTAAAQHMTQLVAAGGVMANGYLRRQMAKYCQERQVRLLLAPPGYSTDNGAGAAFWAAWRERS